MIAGIALSLDEAFLDLSGAEAAHGAPPAVLLTRLQAAIEREVGVTALVGLSANKWLVKFAFDQDKPRGFHMIGPDETAARLAPLPLGTLWGVGPRFAGTLRADGYQRVGDIAAANPHAFRRRYGAAAERLISFARGEDDRPIAPARETTSVSTERTFSADKRAPDGWTRRRSASTASRSNSARLGARTSGRRFSNRKQQSLLRRREYRRRFRISVIGISRSIF